MRWYQPGIMAQDLKLPAQMVSPDGGLHANQAGRQVGKPNNSLTTGQLAPKNDSAVVIDAYDVERVFADIDGHRRQLISRFAGYGPCSFCYPHPKPKGASGSTVGPTH